MFVLGQRFSPALMDLVCSRKRALMDMQQTELSAQSQDYLVEPPIASQHVGSDRLEASTKVKKVKKRSIFTEVVWQHPIVKRALVGTAMVGSTALGGRLLSTARRRLERRAAPAV